jgi:hypothetical protein
MDLTEKIKAQVKENTSDRYKLAVQVHIGSMEVRWSALLRPLMCAFGQVCCAPWFAQLLSVRPLSRWLAGTRHFLSQPMPVG